MKINPRQAPPPSRFAMRCVHCAARFALPASTPAVRQLMCAGHDLSSDVVDKHNSSFLVGYACCFFVTGSLMCSLLPVSILTGVTASASGYTLVIPL